MEDWRLNGQEQYSQCSWSDVSVGIYEVCYNDF